MMVEKKKVVERVEGDSVNLIFLGLKTKEMAKRFFTYLVDGGLEDILIESLSGQGITLGISGCDKKTLTVSFEVAKDKPAKKAAVRKAPKKAVKKGPAKRGRKA